MKKLNNSAKKKVSTDRLSNLVSILLSPFILWAIIYGIRNRTLENFIKYSLYFALPFFFLILLVAVISLFPTKVKHEGLRDYWTIPIFIVLMPFIGAIVYSIFASIKDVYLWTMLPSSSAIGAIIVTILITLTLGIGLFFFRLRMRSIYGLSEAIVGLFIAGNKVASVTENPETSRSGLYLAILTAGVYLVVRGLDNLHQGLTKRPRDRIFLKALVFLRRHVLTPKERSDRTTYELKAKRIKT